MNTTVERRPTCGVCGCEIESHPGNCSRHVHLFPDPPALPWAVLVRVPGDRSGEPVEAACVLARCESEADAIAIRMFQARAVGVRAITAEEMEGTHAVR